ncbi:MAG: ribokinase [Bacteroidales bacterium]
MNKKVVVFGSLNRDYYFELLRFPNKGETVFSNITGIDFGGKGLNQLFACSLLGAKHCFIGTIGDDDAGFALQVFFKNNNITHILNKTKDLYTGTAYIFVEKETGENSIIVNSGANYSKEVSFDKIFFNLGDIASSVFEVPQHLIIRFFSKAKSQGAKTVLNPSPSLQIDPLLKELVDVFIVNETELMSLFEVYNIKTEKSETAISFLQKKGFPQKDVAIVLTLGDKGALLYDKGNCYEFSSQKTNVVDTTGAGDCFSGALCTALSRGCDLQTAVKFAVKMAGMTVQYPGTTSSYQKAFGK